MRNIASHHDMTEEVVREFTRLGIQIVDTASSDHEVKSSKTGLISVNGVELQVIRHWSYFGVYGLLPYEIAVKLYEDPIGKTDIRVAGHCGCPSPEEWSQWILPDGRQVYPTKSQAEFEKYKDLLDEKFREMIFHDIPEYLGAKRYVKSYHIDSELGMYIFLQTINNYHKVI